MRRHRKSRGAPAPENRFPVIEPTRLFSREEVCRLLKKRPTSVKAEVDSGRLRCRWDGRRQLFLGEWLLAWVKGESGESAGK